MVHMSYKLPAGGFITTAPDLVAFAAAFMGGRLVSPETVKMMLAPHQTTDIGNHLSTALAAPSAPAALAVTTART